MPPQIDAPALTQLIPVQELAPGAVSAIRNQVINALLDQASKELNLPRSQLVVRDVQPKNDLQMYGDDTTDATSEMWGHTNTGTTTGYVAVNAATKTMGDQRYAAIFGVRDRGINAVASGSATKAQSASQPYKQVISLVKINVGGADKVLWDLTGMYAYAEARVAFSPSAVVIPQNAAYVISYYRQGILDAGALGAPVADEIAWLQLVGVVVEPRGKLISP